MNETLLLIGGEWVPAAPASKDVRFFHRLNPISDKPVTRAAASSVADVEAAVKAAAEAFPAWAATGPGNAATCCCGPRISWRRTNANLSKA